jgi:hypothetical protein
LWLGGVVFEVKRVVLWVGIRRWGMYKGAGVLWGEVVD